MLSYSIFRLNQKKCALDDDRNAKIDEWKRETVPVEQWLVEENNKFDAHSLSPGAGLDVVRKKRKEKEVFDLAVLIRVSKKFSFRTTFYIQHFHCYFTR